MGGRGREHKDVVVRSDELTESRLGPFLASVRGKEKRTDNNNDYVLIIIHPKGRSSAPKSISCFRLSERKFPRSPIVRLSIEPVCLHKREHKQKHSISRGSGAETEIHNLNLTVPS